MATSSKLEFIVQMTCHSCEDAVRKSLANIEGIKSVEINLEKEQVVVETSLTSSKVKELIESSGKRAVLQGFGVGKDKPHMGAAVAIMQGQQMQGVIRMVQADLDHCIIEGTIDGFSPGTHQLNIHELGDISRGCESCGDVFGLGTSKELFQPVGVLGDITADKDGRSEFRFENSKVKVWDVIGRSMVLQDHGKRTACGIIARSAGLFENAKRICACDGVPLWDERDVPVAGKGRQSYKDKKTDLSSQI